MSAGISTTVQELVAKFERGGSVAFQLEAINKEDPETITEWLGENDIWLSDVSDENYIIIVDELSVFIVEDELFDYYEKDYLAALERDGILKFINEQLHDCSSSYNDSLLCFHQFTPQTVISLRAVVHGKPGFYVHEIALTKTPQERVEQIISKGYIFETDERFTYPTDLAIQKYHEFISPRLK